MGRSDLQPCQDPSVSGCFSPQDEILNDTQELQKELKLLKKDYEKASQQRIFVRQEQQDVAEVIVFGKYSVGMHGNPIAASEKWSGGNSTLLDK